MRPGEFITSDTHFGHKAMIGFAGRPFRWVDQMDEELIRRWNAKVPQGSIVYHLGDFSFHKAPANIAILQRLNGTIRLVKGNHDKKNVTRSDVAAHFDWIRDMYESTCEDGTRIHMCHYPLMTWNKAHYGALHCHGHSHGNLPDNGTTRVDVGVDTTEDLAPLSFSELMERFSGRTYKAVDHHVPREGRA